MKHSESIKEIAAALAKAQGNRFAEAVLVPRMRMAIHGQNRANQNCGLTPLSRFFGKVSFGASDCWYWTGSIDPLGYGHTKSVGENRSHRVSWVLFNGPIPMGLKVLHKCDVRNCVNPEHLFLGTQLDNMRDMYEKGRGNHPGLHGERNPMCRLTVDRVKALRKRYAEGGLTFKQLAKLFGVSTMTAYRAVRRQSWETVQ